jgi:hypothetical protein
VSLQNFNKIFRYRGVHSASTKLNAAGEEVKTAEVVFEDAQLAKTDT